MSPGIPVSPGPTFLRISSVHASTLNTLEQAGGRDVDPLAAFRNRFTVETFDPERVVQSFVEVEGSGYTDRTFQGKML